MGVHLKSDTLIEFCNKKCLLCVIIVVSKGYLNGFNVFRFGMNRVRGTNINFIYVGTIYRMKMLIELAEVNQFFLCLNLNAHCIMIICLKFFVPTKKAAITQA